MVEGIEVYPMRTLRESIEFFAGEHRLLQPFHVDMHEVFSDVRRLPMSILPMSKGRECKTRDESPLQAAIIFY